MSHHCILFPKVGSAGVLLTSVGLGEDAASDPEMPLGGVSLTDVERTQTPYTGEAAATLVYWGGKPTLTDMTWVEADGYHVGYDAANPPTPRDLMRPRVVAGSSVTLGGHDWLVPGLAYVDRVYTCNAGEWSYRVPQRLARYVAQADEVRKSLVAANAAGESSIDAAPLLEFVAEALRLNYRLPAALIGELELLTSGIEGTLRAAVNACLWEGLDLVHSCPIDWLRPVDARAEVRHGPR